MSIILEDILKKIEEGVLSVVVPVYNAEGALERCVRSILGSSYSNVELILIDDGSKDRSGEICDRFAETDERVKVIHKENEGPSAARNLGLEKMTGEYLAFIDADDTVKFDMFERLIKAIKDRDLVAAECRWNEVHDSGNTVLGVLTAFGDFRVGDVRKVLAINSRSVGAGFMWNMVFNTKKICYECGEMPKFNANCHWYEDTCYQLAVYKSVSPEDKISVEDFVGYNYYIYDNSTSHKERALSDELNRVESYEYMSSLIDDIPFEEYKKFRFILSELVFGLAWGKRRENIPLIWEKYEKDYIGKGGISEEGKKYRIKKYNIKRVILFFRYILFVVFSKLKFVKIACSAEKEGKIC